MSETESGTPGKGWHVAQWPLLAWLETAIKLVAIAIGMIALVQAIVGGTFYLPRGLCLAQWVIMIVLSLGLVAAILDRLAEKEIVAMVFVVLNNIGHWGMVVAMATLPGPGILLTLFAALMVAGDLVKLVFLNVHDFSVRDTPPVVLYGLTGFYIVGYLVVLLIQFVG
jgi:hypothetical protein